MIVTYDQLTILQSWHFFYSMSTAVIVNCSLPIDNPSGWDMLLIFIRCCNCMHCGGGCGMGRGWRRCGFESRVMWIF